MAILGQMQDVDGETGDGADRREIDRVMASHPDDPAGDADRLVRMRRATRRLVRRHRENIEHVAAELAARGALPGLELDEMVPGPAAGPPDPMWEALHAVDADGEILRIVRPA